MNDIMPATSGNPNPTALAARTPSRFTDLDRPTLELENSGRERYRPSAEELARRELALQRLIEHAAERHLSPEEYMRAGGRSTEMHQLLDLDADSACPLDGACLYPYLTAGGRS